MVKTDASIDKITAATFTAFHTLSILARQSIRRLRLLRDIWAISGVGLVDVLAP
jgi:hypothetical protein